MFQLYFPQLLSFRPHFPASPEASQGSGVQRKRDDTPLKYLAPPISHPSSLVGGRALLQGSV